MIQDIVRICGHHFLSRGLNSQSLILDLGANRGAFAREVQARWGAHCISVEADPSLCDAWSCDNIIINAAVSGRPGILDLYINENSEANSLFASAASASGTTVKVPAMTVDAIFDTSKRSIASLVKIDIEGSEIDAIMGASDSTLSAFQQISVEFHDSILPEIKSSDVALVKRRLQRLGFTAISFSRRNTDVLFINNNSGIVSMAEILWIRVVLKNVLGIQRMLSRYCR